MKYRDALLLADKFIAKDKGGERHQQFKALFKEVRGGVYASNGKDYIDSANDVYHGPYGIYLYIMRETHDRYDKQLHLTLHILKIARGECD